MKIEVLFFAQLREAFGTDRRVIEIEKGQTVRDVAALLIRGENHPGIAGLPVSYAVNEEIVSGDRRLEDGDRVAFLTPVSGG